MKKIIAIILIVVGCVCIVAPVAYELIQYPWFTVNNNEVNNIVLPSPEPPSIPYVLYQEPVKKDENELLSDPENDSQRSFPAEFLNEIRPIVLPGEETINEKPTTPVTYVLLGSIQIPRINISVNLLEGTYDQMHYGAGHLEGTVMPGEEGNTVIAAHRSSNSGMQPFRHLDKVVEGDHITINFNGGDYVYEVFETLIVPKEEIEALAPLPDEKIMLTLVTCDPVVYTANRPNRLLVRARLIN